MCPAGYTRVGSQCFEAARVTNTLNSATDVRVQYRDLRETDTEVATSLDFSSGTMATRLDVAAKMCDLAQSTVACQALGNLCVLQHYDDTATACTAYKAVSLQRKSATPAGTNGFADWPSGMPWLTYDGLASAVLGSVQLIETDVAFIDPTTGSAFSLEFYVGSYALDGTWLGFARFSELFDGICADGKSMPALEFGRNIEFQCTVDLRKLVSRQTVFYDLYLLDNAALKPVPLLHKNLHKGGVAVNENENALANAQLSRRFFVVDTASGISSGSNSTPEIIRHPTAIELRIQMQPKSKTKILPPLLILSFGERRTASIGLGKHESTLSFKVRFSDDLGWWKQLQYVCIGIGAAASLVLWAKRLFCWMRRNHTRSSDMLFVIVVQAANSFSDVFFWVLLIPAVYTLAFFKGQKAVSILPPSTSDLQAFGGILAACLACKTLGMIHILYRQSTVDLFFVDWEKTRGKLMPRGQEKAANAPISVWRSLFAVNEWNEL
jgi:meckelin